MAPDLHFELMCFFHSFSTQVSRGLLCMLLSTLAFVIFLLHMVSTTEWIPQYLGLDGSASRPYFLVLGSWTHKHPNLQSMYLTPQCYCPLDTQVTLHSGERILLLSQNMGILDLCLNILVITSKIHLPSSYQHKTHHISKTVWFLPLHSPCMYPSHMNLWHSPSTTAILSTYPRTARFMVTMCSLEFSKKFKSPGGWPGVSENQWLKPITLC